MGTESHYHSKKDRVFVRGIQGHYNLKEELQRLRSMPRVVKGKEIKFIDGVGYEIHDGVRYDWKAGDVAIVHNNCVHQHFNASETKPARALVLKSKPMFLFLNMLFQKTVEPRPTEPAVPAGVGFEPRHYEQDYNHDPDAAQPTKLKRPTKTRA